jgi:hypothetical protein
VAQVRRVDVVYTVFHKFVTICVTEGRTGIFQSAADTSYAYFGN